MTELIRQISIIATPPLLVFVGWMQMAESQRAQERWESPAFERRVADIVQQDLSKRDLATKDDIAVLSSRIGELSAQMQPITTYLIKRGIIE
jgi:hypothetical protein